MIARTEYLCSITDQNNSFVIGLHGKPVIRNNKGSNEIQESQDVIY